jgi:mRNA-degrading endonuclease toxin of MazEF toxin-antitoxin module
VTGSLRGFIYWAHLDKRRPAVVVSHDARNRYANDLVVVPCSTSARPLAWHVRLGKGEGGLPEASVAKCEQITTVRKTDVELVPLGPALPGAPPGDRARHPVGACDSRPLATPDMSWRRSSAPRHGSKAVPSSSRRSAQELRQARSNVPSGRCGRRAAYSPCRYMTPSRRHRQRRHGRSLRTARSASTTAKYAPSPCTNGGSPTP